MTLLASIEIAACGIAIMLAIGIVASVGIRQPATDARDRSMQVDPLTGEPV